MKAITCMNGAMDSDIGQHQLTGWSYRLILPKRHIPRRQKQSDCDKHQYLQRFKEGFHFLVATHRAPMSNAPVAPFIHTFSIQSAILLYLDWASGDCLILSNSG